MYSNKEYPSQKDPTPAAGAPFAFERQPQRRKWHQHWWVRGLLAVATLFLILLIAYGFYILNFVAGVKSGRINPQQYLINQSRSRNPAAPTMATSDDPSLGPANAKVVIVEFSDFECPFCHDSYLVVKELLRRHGTQIRFMYRDFPLVDNHPRALAAALAANCAQEQNKFWPMHDKLFENQAALEDADLKRYALQIGLNSIQFGTCLQSQKYLSEIEQDFNDGILAGVEATPTFFINGQKAEGTLPLETMEQTVASELNSKQ